MHTKQNLIFALACSSAIVTGCVDSEDADELADLQIELEDDDALLAQLPADLDDLDVLDVLDEDADLEADLDHHGAFAPDQTGTDPEAFTASMSGFAWVQGSGTLGTGYNGTGGAVSTSKLGTGQYLVEFAGHVASGSNAQVTAYGNAATQCKLLTTPLGSSSYVRWYVLCYDAAGTLTDSPFNIVTENTSGGGEFGAYLFATGSSTYHSWNSSGGTNTVTNTSTGLYTVTMPGMPSSNAAVHVTATGANANRCKITSWGTGSVGVRCYNASGALANTSFSVSYRSIGLIRQKIGGHAWINNGTVPSIYAAARSTCWANPPFSVTPVGSDIDVTLPQSDWAPGHWSNVMPIVTAYGSNANHCKVTFWNVVGDTTTARVRCFNNAGVQVNASTTSFDFSLTHRHGPFC